MSNTGSQTPRIVIVGGGAGGLELATRLGRSAGIPRKARIILVDGSPTHIWKPLLHEVATGALNTGEDEVNYFAHGYHNGYEFEFGCMQSIDVERQCIILAEVYGADGIQLSPAREIGYNKLVLSVGAESNDFSTPGAAEHALFLNTPSDADALRHRILERAFACSSIKNEKKTINITIVGGGPTGVELAAELRYTLNELHQFGAHLTRDQVNIRIIEGADRILATAPPALSLYATAQLKKQSIQVLTNHRVAKVEHHQVTLSDNNMIDSDITIWAAGVKAPEWLSRLGLNVNTLNQLLVDSRLRCLNSTNIHAIGDCAATLDDSGNRYLPATAQVARQQAQYLARTLVQALQGKAPLPFIFKPQGMVVSLGKSRAVASLASLIGPKRSYHVEGRHAKLIYISLYRLHQAVVHGWVRMGLLYIGDKLRRVVRPSLKLH